MAGFEKGIEKVEGSGKKPGFRASAVRHILAENLVDQVPRLFEELGKLKGLPYIKGWSEIARYSFPQLSAIKVDDNGKAATMLDLIKQTAMYHREEREKDKNK